MIARVAFFLALVATGGVRERLEVRIEGFLNPTAQEEQTAWKVLGVRVGEGPLQKFALGNVIMLSSGKVSGSDIVAQVEPTRPSFIFAGEAAFLEPLTTAKPNQLLKIRGMVTYGSPWVQVIAIDRSAPITGPTATPTTLQRIFGF